MIMPWTVSSPLRRSSSVYEMSGDLDAVLAGLLERLADLRRIRPSRTVPVGLSLNAKMISVPPLKSIVQFMYSPRDALLTNKEPMATAMSRIEMTSQALNFATNAKLLPGGSR